MKTRRIDAVKNVDQRVRDERAKKVIMVAMENHPESVYDFDKLIRTHSCKKRADLLERVIMIAASYLPNVDRKYLRNWAFCTMPIDWHIGVTEKLARYCLLLLMGTSRELAMRHIFTLCSSRY